MTKFSSRAELLASGAREVTMEEMDWVSGGSTASADELDPEEIVVVGERPHGPSIGGGGGGTNLAFAGFFATHSSYGDNPKIDLELDLDFILGPDADPDGDGDPNATDLTPFDDTIVVTAPYNSTSLIIIDRCGSGPTQGIPDYYRGIYIGHACLTHDENYGPSSSVSRYDADLQLAKDIASILTANGLSAREAKAVGAAYFLGVRAGGGLFYEGAGERDISSDRFR